MQSFFEKIKNLNNCLSENKLSYDESSSIEEDRNERNETEKV